MKCPRLIPVLATLSCLQSASALGEEFFSGVSYLAGAYVGYSNLSFPEKLDHDVSFPSSNVFLAAGRDRWLLSFNAAFNVQDADISEEEDTGKASRKDFDLTLGYQVNDHWGLFAGYKSGETEMDFVPRDREDDDELLSSDEKYSQQGPFFGASYSWRFKKAGRLTVSAAYAILDGDNDFGANTDDEEEDDDEPPEFDDLTGQASGDVKGFSYAVNWTMPLSPNLLFQTRFKINDYQRDLKVEGQKFDGVDETYSSLHVGLAYVF